MLVGSEGQRVGVGSVWMGGGVDDCVGENVNCVSWEANVDVDGLVNVVLEVWIAPR